MLMHNNFLENHMIPKQQIFFSEVFNKVRLSLNNLLPNYIFILLNF